MPIAPRTSRRWFRNGLLLAMAAGLGAAAWYFTRPRPVAVRLELVERGRVESTVANTRAGTVEACRRARLAPVTGGWIARLPVREGARVEAGQVLLALWNEDLKAAQALAERQAEAAGARADEACVVAEEAEREANRLHKLHKQGVASEESADRAISEAKARRAACRAARATAEVGVAQVAVAQANVERTILRAPFAGTVAEINGEVGEFVTPSPLGVPTLPAVDLVDNGCPYVTAPMDEVDAPAIRPGMEARITLDAFPGRPLPGRVRRVASYVLDVEKQARTVDVEVDFVNPDDAERLLPGYSADVEVVLATREDVLRIPTEAVLEGHRVLVYRALDGTLEERAFEPGISSWEFTEVVEGLDAGERIAVSVDREGVGPGSPVVPETPGSGRSGGR